MKYKEIPKELISNWFMDKINLSLNTEQLNDLCSKIDNHAKINFVRCCEKLPCKNDKTSEILEKLKEFTTQITELNAKDNGLDFTFSGQELKGVLKDR